MGWFTKRSDPIAARERILKEEIATLEAQIKQLDSQLQQGETEENLSPSQAFRAARAVPAPLAREPIFEELDRHRLESKVETGGTPAHYNELGVRKYDLPALWRRMRTHRRGPATTNPKLVSYLAAGGIQGLRPMRYEKRVARNRFIALVIVLFLTLLGIIAVFFRHR